MAGIVPKPPNQIIRTHALSYQHCNIRQLCAPRRSNCPTCAHRSPGYQWAVKASLHCATPCFSNYSSRRLAAQSTTHPATGLSTALRVSQQD
eukprot:41176-Amphidinium_carterae.1